jgi:Flp pilus assembly protein TadB
MQMKYELNGPGKSQSLLRKLLTLVMAVAVLALVVMFSVVLLTVLVVVGATAWAYLWWKTRTLRKQMRDMPRNEMHWDAKRSDDAMFEGEVIRVVDTPKAR